MWNDKSLSHSHSPSSCRNCETPKTRKVLIAEPEEDILLLYQRHLGNFGFCVTAVDDGDKAFECFFQQKTQRYDVDNDDVDNDCYNHAKDNKRIYELVMLNTHLAGKSGLDVAKEIRKKNPNQRIIITTTTPIENLPEPQLEAANINKEEILTMPFRLTKLISMIKGQAYTRL
jgi:DNA-binding response OmpR family regulator